MEKTISDHRVLSPEDIRKHLHVGKNTVYSLFADKSFPSFRLGRRLFVEENQYYQWLERQGNRYKYTPYDKRKK